MEANLEVPTILIAVEKLQVDAKRLKLLKYQADLALLWYYSFCIAATTKGKKFGDGKYYNQNFMPVGAKNYICDKRFTIDTLRNLETKDPSSVSNAYINIASGLITRIAPVNGFSLSCGECTIGTFYSGISDFGDIGMLRSTNVKAKILATYILLISYARQLHRTGFCLMHTTMVKISGYEFYYKVIAKYGLALSEIEFNNTNTGRTLSAVNYLTDDVADKICNQELDLEELFLLPDFIDYKDSSSYLFKDLQHIVDYMTK